MSGPPTEGPKDRYDAGVQNGEYQFDEAQAQALIMLQSLYEELIAATAHQGRNKPGFFLPW